MRNSTNPKGRISENFENHDFGTFPKGRKYAFCGLEMTCGHVFGLSKASKLVLERFRVKNPKKMTTKDVDFSKFSGNHEIFDYLKVASEIFEKI